MKHKNTMKNIKGYAMATGMPIYKVGYCELQNELKNIEPDYYTCGVYGWNADIYIMSDFIICTGYRPFGQSIGLDEVKALVNKKLEA